MRARVFGAFALYCGASVLAENHTVGSRDSRITYVGLWTDVDNGGHKFTNLPPGSASFTFTGSTIYYLSAQNFNGGLASISVDGQGSTIVDESAGTVKNEAERGDQVLYSKTGLDGTKQHTIQVTYAGAGAFSGNFVELYGFIYDDSIVNDTVSSSSSSSLPSSSSSSATSGATSSPSSHHSSNGGAIGGSVGGALGGLLIGAVVTLIVVLCLRRRRRAVTRSTSTKHDLLKAEMSTRGADRDPEEDVSPAPAERVSAAVPVRMIAVSSSSDSDNIYGSIAVPTHTAASASGAHQGPEASMTQTPTSPSSSNYSKTAAFTRAQIIASQNTALPAPSQPPHAPSLDTVSSTTPTAVMSPRTAHLSTANSDIVETEAPPGYSERPS